MAISMEELKADFLIGSGHKSMASAGPVGVLGMKRKWEETLLRKSGRFADSGNPQNQKAGPRAWSQRLPELVKVVLQEINAA
jgi:selenocysteine lyase/cysteine desulfurase